MAYSDADNSHEFLVEKVILQENLIRELVSILAHFHPYLGPVIAELAAKDQAACAELVKRFPASKIVVPNPGLTIVKSTH